MAKILIVEDESIIAMAMRADLRKTDHEVLLAYTGEEGVEMANENGPDLILMDIKLPGIDGIEATTKINRNIPVIYITAYADEITINRAKETKAIGLVQKPLMGTVLCDIVEKSLQGEKHEHVFRFE